jgi:hypothetical protein
MKNTKTRKVYYFQLVMRAAAFVAFVFFVAFVLKSKRRTRQMVGRERRGSKAVAFDAVKTRFAFVRTQWPASGRGDLQQAVSTEHLSGCQHRAQCLTRNKKRPDLA